MLVPKSGMFKTSSESVNSDGCTKVHGGRENVSLHLNHLVHLERAVETQLSNSAKEFFRKDFVSIKSDCYQVTDPMRLN